MNDTERLYLQAADDRADQKGFFYEEEVGERIGLDPALPGLRNELIRTSQSLLGRGYIEPGHKGSGPGRRGLRITTEAKDIARKQDPQRLLEAVYALAEGEPSRIVSWRDLAPEVGWSPENAEHHSRSLAAAEVLQQANYITFEVEEGDAYRVTARGMDQVEGKVQSIASPPIEPEREVPPEIQDSLKRFQVEHTDHDRVAFIMMQFKPGKPHEDITEAIKAGLGSHGIVGMRADEKDYHDDVFSNVLTYMYGCGFGIAVFDLVEAETHNPNVALEVGYMLALGKSVCLLKDQRLPRLQTDLVAKRYRQFDSYDPTGTIPRELTSWLRDRGLSRR